MKMAKATQADMDAAIALYSALDALTDKWLPIVPDAIAKPQSDNEAEVFDAGDSEQCQRVLRHLLDLFERRGLIRVVWGAIVMLDPENEMVDANDDCIEHHPRRVLAEAAMTPRPASEYHEDMGPVLWWTFPINEPPYVGQPSDSDWPGEHTHFTPILCPDAPQIGAMEPSA